jgi:hypothetical protein
MNLEPTRAALTEVADRYAARQLRRANDVALFIVDVSLVEYGRNRAVADALLDIRNALRTRDKHG